MSADVPLHTELYLFQGLSLPYLRFSRNRSEVSRSLHLHFSPSSWLPLFIRRISSLVILIPALTKKKRKKKKIKRKSDLLSRPSRLIHCVPSPVFSHSSRSASFLSCLAPDLSISSVRQWCLFTADSTGRMNISERSIRSCVCTTETLPDDGESKHTGCCGSTLLMRSFKPCCFCVLISVAVTERRR